MSEKVLHEIRIIETEDGYRIEMKGDKERLRGIVEQLMSGQGHHHGKGGKWHGKRWGFKRGPWFMRRFGMWGRPHHQPLPPDFQPHHAPPHGKHGYDLGPWFDEGDAPGEDVLRRF
jgi:hypothetical protein